MKEYLKKPVQIQMSSGHLYFGKVVRVTDRFIVIHNWSLLYWDKGKRILWTRKDEDLTIPLCNTVKIWLSSKKDWSKLTDKQTGENHEQDRHHL